MKLKSYFNATTREAQVRLAADAAPAAPFVALGDVTHEPVDDNASGMQKHDISHVLYQHIQERLYLQFGLQDMQIIKITYGGNFKVLQRVFVDLGINRLGYNVENTVTVTLDPVDATNDGITFTPSNPDLVTVVANTGNGVYTFKGPNKGAFFLKVRVNNFEQNIPFEITEELPGLPVPVTSITLPAPAITLTVAAPTFQLVPAILPDNATDKSVTYVSSAPAIATVSATGLVTRIANGTSNITVTAKDGSGKSVVKAVTCTA